jgi:hypothetical protein
MTITGSITEALPEYWRDIYGEATITWVPPVSNYDYPENVGTRTAFDRTFRWEEVSIDLEDVQDGCLIDFTVPDSYIIQITPDIGWANILGMFGEEEELELQNPHLVSVGPFSIVGGTLTDNADGTVSVTISQADIERATIPGYTKYLWRSVPWADNNPGLGGLPVPFSYISNLDQLDFSVDDIIKETRRAIQTISGTKSSLAIISIENQNNPTVFVEQTEVAWRVYFTIDRPLVQFRIQATDVSGTLVGLHQVSIEYETFNQEDGHVWNSFDGFGLIASVERLPRENNANFSDRIIDSFTNRGGSNYSRLIGGINRELGLNRLDNGILIIRVLNAAGKPVEPVVDIEATHTRISVRAPSFIRTDELKKVDSFLNTITTDKRIHNIITIVSSRSVELPTTKYYITDEPEGNEIEFAPDVSGIYRVTYEYIEDINYDDNPLIGDVCTALNSLTNPAGNTVVSAETDPKLSGSESSRYIYKQSNVISQGSPTIGIGWSRIGLSSISNREWKRSFRDSNSLYFNSQFYKYVLELKSQTNIEWGFVVADKDFWDPLESSLYGRQSLEVPFDIKLSQYSTPIKLPDVAGRDEFDAWEAFRMGYYFDDHILKNYGFPKIAFRSGVGFKKDCFVGIHSISLRAPEDKINQNPVVEIPEDAIDIDPNKISDIIISF